ncbi:class I poly(R)-hydroxyalkanoic acid synthase [Roseovarius sp. Pro17]|uniref:PHA/PHB synthase family protein n=1 Tax=Roseovarius sp. Pro17 TaxID=3108175 RepID=UPI002D77C0CF|nr:class I poly(R)-hydroxyalkanoic acid synthase [Roseovarius sp. Pro17]
MSANLARVEALSQRLVAALSSRNPPNSTLNAPGRDLFAKAAASYWSEAIENPSKLYENQIAYWGESVRHFMDAQRQMLTGAPTPAEEETAPRDKRFANPLWATNPYFRYVREQYELNAQAVAKAVAEVDDLDPVEKKRLEYFSRQIIDMMAPTNFLGTNPDALERAVATEGESLVKGLENLVADLEANDGEMVVRLADESAFALGENIATTPGKVVYRNDMMELIQYAPATDKVHEIPLIIFPPWINKFYILDLKEKNSLIKWITEQGFTLFVVSWVNPDVSHADIGLEEYIEDGYLAAIREVRSITDAAKVNVVGYCIAGTTLALTLSLLKARGEAPINAVTFFTALTDFDNQGEFTPFLQDDFVDGIEAEVEAQGILRSFILGRTMSFLRSNDLIYTPAIRSYMLGEAPPAFDLLYWNGDGSNLPGRMTLQYLRELCQKNAFAGEGFELLGHKLKLSDIDVPLMAVTCETDHIAPWKDCFRGMLQVPSKDRTFIVSQSGHIAGIVNPPSKKKYGHYTNGDWSGDAESWMEAATFSEGSWWPRWKDWLQERSGDQIAAREPGDSDHPALDDAPGTYVRRRATR